MSSTIKDMADSTFFGIMSMVQKSGFNEADVNYWKAKGWTNGKKPWKK